MRWKILGISIISCLFGYIYLKFFNPYYVIWFKGNIIFCKKIVKRDSKIDFLNCFDKKMYLNISDEIEIEGTTNNPQGYEKDTNKSEKVLELTVE